MKTLNGIITIIYIFTILAIGMLQISDYKIDNSNQPNHSTKCIQYETN